MSLKKLAAVLFAVLALGAVAANSASAAATTTRAEWYTGAGAGVTLAGEQNLTASIKSGTTFTLMTTILGTTVHLTATGVECVGCKISNAEETSKAGAIAIGKGNLKFTGVTAMEPTGCTVRNGSSTGAVGVIETKPLIVHGDWMVAGNEKGYQQFIPQAGATANFATVWLGGGNCTAIEGPYNVKGTAFTRSANNTGVSEATQEASINAAIQSETGGALTLGENPVELVGSAVFSIGGTAFDIR
jgi:hypothetical protein